MRLGKLAAALAAVVFSMGALAQETAKAPGHFYAGGGYGQSHWSPGCPSSAATCDNTGASVHAFGGWQLNNHFAGEIAFTNLGKATGTNTEVKGHAWEASLLAGWPLSGSASVYGRLGIYRGVVKGGGMFANHTETNYYATYGIGAQMDFTQNLGARLEWQKFPGLAGSSIIDNDVTIISLSAFWRFR